MTPEKLRLLAAEERKMSKGHDTMVDAFLMEQLAAALERIAVLEDEVTVLRGVAVGESPLVARVEKLEHRADAARDRLNALPYLEQIAQDREAGERGT